MDTNNSNDTDVDKEMYNWLQHVNDYDENGYGLTDVGFVDCPIIKDIYEAFEDTSDRSSTSTQSLPQLPITADIPLMITTNTNDDKNDHRSFSDDDNYTVTGGHRNIFRTIINKIRSISLFRYMLN